MAATPHCQGRPPAAIRVRAVVGRADLVWGKGRSPRELRTGERLRPSTPVVAIGHPGRQRRGRPPGSDADRGGRHVPEVRRTMVDRGDAIMNESIMIQGPLSASPLNSGDGHTTLTPDHEEIERAGRALTADI